MDAVLVALASAALGALVAGAADLWLAQRTERRAALAGATQLKADLDSAKKLIDAYLAEKVWWPSIRAPSTAAWELYQQALVAQLPPKQTTKLQNAVQTLINVNVHAELKQQRYALSAAQFELIRNAEVDSRAARGVPDPVRSVDEDENFQQELRPYKPSLDLDDVDVQILETARTRVTDAISALEDSATTRALGQRPSKWRWVEWGVVTAIIVAAVLAVSWAVAPEREVSADSVQQALAKTLSGGPSVECHAVPGWAGSRWMCLATYGGDTSALNDAAAVPKDPVATVALASASSVRTLTNGPALVVRPMVQHPRVHQGSAYYAVDTINKQLAASARLILGSGSVLEPDDPHPNRTGTNIQNGMVPVPVDNSSDTHQLALSDPGKDPWWRFW